MGLRDKERKKIEGDGRKERNAEIESWKKSELSVLNWGEGESVIWNDWLCNVNQKT